jgi:hypothetical protein
LRLLVPYELHRFDTVRSPRPEEKDESTYPKA